MIGNRPRCLEAKGRECVPRIEENKPPSSRSKNGSGYDTSGIWRVKRPHVASSLSPIIDGLAIAVPEVVDVRTAVDDIAVVDDDSGANRYRVRPDDDREVIANLIGYVLLSVVPLRTKVVVLEAVVCLKHGVCVRDVV